MLFDENFVMLVLVMVGVAVNIVMLVPLEEVVVVEPAFDNELVVAAVVVEQVEKEDHQPMMLVLVVVVDITLTDLRE